VGDPGVRFENIFDSGQAEETTRRSYPCILLIVGSLKDVEVMLTVLKKE